MAGWSLTRKDVIFSVALILLGVGLRTMPHIANMSPMIAIAVCSAYYFRRRSYAWAVPLATALLSDALIGFYAPTTMFVVWACYPLIALSSRRILTSTKLGIGGQLLAATSGAALFFVLTNVAVWAEGTMYSLNARGLASCFVAALPFFRATLVSALIYTPLLIAISHLYKTQNNTVSPHAHPNPRNT